MFRTIHPFICYAARLACMTVPNCAIQYILQCSWWWTGESFETCRARKNYGIKTIYKNCASRWSSTQAGPQFAIIFKVGDTISGLVWGPNLVELHVLSNTQDTQHTQNVDPPDRSFHVRHDQADCTTPAAVKFMFHSVPDSLTNPPLPGLQKKGLGFQPTTLTD